MVTAEQIKEHAEVIGSDGEHVGTVDHMQDGRIKLTKKDPDAHGEHHFLELSKVDTIEGDKVKLNIPAQQVKEQWATSPSPAGI